MSDVEFRLEEDSYATPLNEAFAACEAAFLSGAREKTSGSEARARARLDDLRYLKAFNDAVSDMIRTDSFRDLPRVREGGSTLIGLHALTVGPWRGVFLVMSGGRSVVGLAFSREPHRFDQRLNEIVRRYQSEDEPGYGE